MTTYCWKFWKSCLNLNRTRLHIKIRPFRPDQTAARAEQLHESLHQKNLLFISLRWRIEETHNSQKNTTHVLIFILQLQFPLKSQQKVDIKLSKMCQGHQKLSEWQKVASRSLAANDETKMAALGGIAGSENRLISFFEVLSSVWTAHPCSYENLPFLNHDPNWWVRKLYLLVSLSKVKQFPQPLKAFRVAFLFCVCPQQMNWIHKCIFLLRQIVFLSFQKWCESILWSSSAT